MFLLEVCLEPSFSSGHIESSIETTYRPGDNVSVICDTGFKADSLKVTCNASRFWDPQPVCTMVTCPAPVVNNGYYITNSDISALESHTTPDIGDTTHQDLDRAESYTYNTTIYIVCNDGYEANGPTTGTCLADGKWGQQISMCVKIVCNDTTEVNHEALIKFPTDLGLFKTGNASYNSAHFYLSDGGTEVECQVNRRLAWMRRPTFGKRCGKS